MYKALAIFFVVMAHCTYENAAISKINSLFATLGVPIFLFSSGFFFNRLEQANVFWKKKIHGIIVPWIVWGLVTYCLSCILSHSSFDLQRFWKWLLGNGTWLYYVPVLLMCFAIFRICRNVIYDCLLFLLFLVANVLSVIGKIGDTELLTRYQFVLNWCGFFQLGILARNKKQLLRQVCTIRIQAVIVAVWIFAGIGYVLYESPSYWSDMALMYELLGIAAVFFLAKAAVNNKFLIDVGKNTYPIYFIHMQFGVGSVGKLISAIGITKYEWLTIFLKPVMVVLCTWLGIKVMQWLSRKINIGKYVWVLGIKP